MKTHFYFCFYHVLGNCVLRRIATSLPATPQRLCFSVLAVLCAAYTTAFMETLTIAAYPCYKFDDFHRSATIGSAFYGIYFIVSFPMFYRLSGGTSADDDGGRKTLLGIFQLLGPEEPRVISGRRSLAGLLF